MTSSFLNIRSFILISIFLVYYGYCIIVENNQFDFRNNIEREMFSKKKFLRRNSPSKSKTSVDVNIFTKEVSEIVSDRFLSVTLDCTLLRYGWAHLDLTSEKVKSLARHLNPTYLRVGGTLEDFVFFDEPAPNLNYSKKKHANLVPFNITSIQLDQLFTFTTEVGWDVIYALNMLNRNSVSWEPWDAIKILSYLAKKKYPLAGLELGNEPDVYNLILTKRPDPKFLGMDFQHLRKLMKFTPYLNKTLLVGPDVTNICVINKGYIDFFSRYLDAAHTALDAVTIHQYYLNGATAKFNQFYDPKVMDVLEEELLSAHKIVRSHAPGKKIWLGETSAAWNSGAAVLSSSFIAGFLWLDKLGLAARYNVQVVLRQDFYGGNYGLIDYKTLDPNPDYWLSVLYKKFVGNRVLDVALTESNEYIRAYAHCTNLKRTSYSPGSVTLYLLNVNPHQDMNITFSQMNCSLVDIYNLQPVGPMGLESKTVALNGVPLELTKDYDLPKFVPIKDSSPILIPRLSFGFYVFPKANAEACL